MSHVLISGCSFTAPKPNQTSHWTNKLFDAFGVINVAKGGAGNRYIASSILSNIDLENKPAFVFVLWSGLRRIDIPFQTNTSRRLYKSYAYYNKCNDVEYYFTGGNKGMAMPYIDYELHGYSSIEKYRASIATPVVNEPVSTIIREIENEFYRGSNGPLGVEKSDIMCNQLSLEAISSVTNFLDNHDILYNFSFIYDPFSPHTIDEPSLGAIDTSNTYFNHINWNMYIDNTPFEYGLKYDKISNDGFHLTDCGMEQWAKTIKPKLNM